MKARKKSFLGNRIHIIWKNCPDNATLEYTSLCCWSRVNRIPHHIHAYTAIGVNLNWDLRKVYSDDDIACAEFVRDIRLSCTCVSSITCIPDLELSGALHLPHRTLPAQFSTPSAIIVYIYGEHLCKAILPMCDSLPNSIQYIYLHAHLFSRLG